MVRSARESEVALRASIPNNRPFSRCANPAADDPRGFGRAGIAAGGDSSIGIGRRSPLAASAWHDDSGNELSSFSGRQRLEHSDHGTSG